MGEPLLHGQPCARPQDFDQVTIAAPQNPNLPDGGGYPVTFDLRVGENLRFGRTRTNVAIDIYNLFNSNTGTVYNQTYDPVTNGARWLAPTQVLNARFARFNVTIDF